MRLNVNSTPAMPVSTTAFANAAVCAPVRLVIVDDHALFRRGLRQLISADLELDVVAEASCGHEGIEAVLKHMPDVALIDLHMKDIDGATLVRAARSAGCTARFVMLTVSDNKADLDRAFDAGARGYLLKDMEPEELCARVKEAARGVDVVSDRVLAFPVGLSPAEGRARHALWEDLTERERETLELVAQGASNKIVARALGIAESTVKVHVKHVLRKLSLKNRFEAALWLRDQRR